VSEAAAWEPVHFSRLKLLAQSPAHYRVGHAARKETAAMRFGTAVHVLALRGEIVVFDGERAGNRWAAFKELVAGAEPYVYDGPHRGNAWKWAKEEAQGRPIVTSEDVAAAAAGRAIQGQRLAAGRYLSPIVTTAEYDVAARVAEKVRTHAVAGELLDGMHEQPLRWDRAGRACAGTLDVMGPRRIVDLKTTTKADPEWFPHHGRKLHYHAQLDWYAGGARENGHITDACFIVAVETTEPHAVTAFELSERALEAGARQTHLWLERLKGCEAADEWPEYVQSVVPFDLPDDDFFSTLTGL